MKLKIWLTLCALAIAMFAHGYLTLHYYPLHFGSGGGQSLCNLSPVFDCDSVSASKYSSFLGIPLAVWGLASNGVLFLMVLWGWFGLAKNQEQQWRYCLWLATLIFGASIIMAAISATQLRSYCAFCILTYVMSAISFFSLLSVTNKPWPHLVGDITDAFKENRGILAMASLVPVSAFLVHKSMVRNHGAGELEVVITSVVNEWSARTPLDWQAAPSLSKGPAEAKMTIVEFADFRCGHCKMAAPSLAAFAKSHPDVRFMFYNFPLDGECNPAIERGDGISCYLAKSVQCAGQMDAGWPLQELIFQNQETFHKTFSADATAGQLKPLAESLNLDWTKLQECIQNPETHSAIKAQAEEGKRAKIRGTPAVFVNGRLLERGQLIPVLERVYNLIGSTNQ